MLHPRHGVGRIQSIRRQSFLGEEPCRFAKLFFKRDGLTILMRRRDLDETVRSIISAADARKVLDHLESCSAAMTSHWKSRTNRNETAIEDGDPFKLAQVYKGLVHMQAKGQSLRAADRKHLSASFDLLCEELSAALEEKRAAVERMVLARTGTAELVD